MFPKVAVFAAAGFLGSIGPKPGDSEHSPARPVAKRVSRAEAGRAEEYWTPERMRSARPMAMPGGPIQDDTSPGSPDDIAVSAPKDAE